ncbi:MAG: hypothetical protein R3282_00715, partial [Rhodothermales bacterium]|nr:hypothetical protein [Rhodothermales bacterium]
GVIDAAENEAAGIEQMKFYEVGPNIPLTQHAITVRPLCFSNKTFQRLPADLQAAILQAGRDAGTYGRIIEATEDRGKLMSMEKTGKLKTVYFEDRAQLIKSAEPVKMEYAKELGAEQVLQRINAIQ